MTPARPVLHAARWLVTPLLATALLSAQSAELTLIGEIAEAVDTVEIAGTKAYTASGRTLTSYDLVNPASPVRRGAHTFPEEIWSFRVIGSTIYAGVNFFGLGILDVSGAGAPVLRGSFKTPGQAKAGAVFGRRAVVIDHMEGLVDVDLTQPERAVSTGSFFVDGYARDVVAIGSMAYAVDSPSGLYIFDLSRPPPLQPAAAVQSGTQLRMLEVTQMSAGRRLAVLVGGGALQFYDVTAATAPVRLGVLKTPGGAQRVALRSPLAYVADLVAGVQVVDFSQPAMPRIIASYPTPSPTRDVAVDGDLVLAATATNVLVLRSQK